MLPIKSTGRLIGVGVGPGDPELMTLKALRVLRQSPIIAYYAGENKPGQALSIVSGYLRDEQTLVPLIYPVTGRPPPPPFDYEGVMRAFYDQSAQRLVTHLEAGTDVAVLCEGDPLFYGSFMYLHDRLAERFTTEVVPGVCSVVAGAAAVGTPLVYRDQALLIVAGTLPEADLRAKLEQADAAVVMKLGSQFDKVRRVIEQLGLGARALYVEHASMTSQRVLPFAEVDPSTVPYFAMVLIPGIRWQR